MEVGEILRPVDGAEVGSGERGGACGEGFFGEWVAVDVEEAEAGVAVFVSAGGGVDDLQVIGGLVELDVERFAGEAGGEEGGVGFEVVGIELPDETGLGGVGHPGDDAGDGVEEFGEAAFVHGPEGFVGGELAFLREVFEGIGGAVAISEAGDEAVALLGAFAEVVLGPVVVDRPPVFFGHHVVDGFEGGDGDGADFGFEGFGLGELVVLAGFAPAVGAAGADAAAVG